jgi:TRAP-type C4-dicarboxylate transport system permease small subunit
MEKILRTIASGIERLSWFAEILAESALMGLLLLVSHEVFVRYVLDRPTIFSVEISEYLLVFISVMSAGWVLREDRHVRMLALIHILPRKVQLFLDVATSILAIIFCGVLTWKGGQTAVMAYLGDYHSSSLVNFPLWIAYSFIPLGALVLGLQFVVRIGERVNMLLGGDGERAMMPSDGVENGSSGS